MLSQVKRTMVRERMLAEGEPALVCVSGGVDSMVLLHVLHALGHPCEVLHVDHGLRGAESDADVEFVAAHAGALGVPFHLRRAEPGILREVQGASTQMAARDLRYAAIRALLHARGIRVAALAHHRNDAVETLLMNLIRGAGLSGLASIPPTAEGIVRPLIEMGRAEILAYAAEQGVAFREDSSNASHKYMRNRIRHEVMPLLEALRPGATDAMSRSVTMLRELVAGAHGANDPVSHVPATMEKEGIPLEMIRSSNGPHVLLTLLFEGHHVHPGVIDQLLTAIEERAVGARFRIGGLQLLLDREHLLVERTDPVGHTAAIIPEDLALFDDPRVAVRWCTVPDMDHANGMRSAWLDAEKLLFPLELRPWRNGDRMRPIGLGGSKLISDVLIDAKLPLSEKEAVHVLVSGGEVVWLVGHRIAEGVPPGVDTKRVLHLQWMG